MTGTDLIGIMKVMKFAHHLTSFDKDFIDLQEQISKANISYPRKSFSADEVLCLDPKSFMMWNVLSKDKCKI